MKNIVEIYATGLSCKAIGQIIGCCAEKVRKDLRTLGVQRRPKAYRPPVSAPSWSDYFADKTVKNGDCLLWQGFRDGAGYGRLTASFAPGINFAHRLSYFIAFGPFDPNLRILHRCDVPACVNPEHLWLGTQADNVEDMLNKGRNRAGGTKGEAHHGAKLTDDLVKRMREVRGQTNMPFHTIADHFGVSTMTAWRACTGQSWSHLGEAK